MCVCILTLLPDYNCGNAMLVEIRSDYHLDYCHLNYCQCCKSVMPYI